MNQGALQPRRARTGLVVQAEHSVPCVWLSVQSVCSDFPTTPK